MTDDFSPIQSIEPGSFDRGRRPHVNIGMLGRNMGRLHLAQILANWMTAMPERGRVSDKVMLADSLMQTLPLDVRRNVLVVGNHYDDDYYNPLGRAPFMDRPFSPFRDMAPRIQHGTGRYLTSFKLADPGPVKVIVNQPSKQKLKKKLHGGTRRQRKARRG